MFPFSLFSSLFTVFPLFCFFFPTLYVFCIFRDSQHLSWPLLHSIQWINWPEITLAGGHLQVLHASSTILSRPTITTQKSTATAPREITIAKCTHVWFNTENFFSFSRGERREKSFRRVSNMWKSESFEVLSFVVIFRRFCWKNQFSLELANKRISDEPRWVDDQLTPPRVENIWIQQIKRVSFA